MREARRVAITIGLALVTTVSVVRSQDVTGPREPYVRSLSSFESVYVPDLPDGGDDPTTSMNMRPWRLTRELRESLIRQGQSRAPAPYPLPFSWTLVDAIGSTTARTVVATAKADPARRSRIVIEFADTDGNPVAAVHGSTIGAAIRVLNDLSLWTTGDRGRVRASRPVGTFPIMHLSYQNPVSGNDEFNLLSRLISAFRQRGPWSLVDSLPVEGDPRRAQTVQCFVWHVRGSLPTSVSLRCSVPRFGVTAGTSLPWDPRRAEHVLFMSGASCKGCFSSDLVFSSVKTRAVAATDDLARDVLAHVELEQRVYSPQGPGR